MPIVDWGETKMQVTITRAKQDLDDLVKRAASGERIIIQQSGQAAAVLISADELERLEQPKHNTIEAARSLGQDEDLLQRIQDGELHPAMAAFGLWKDDNAFDDLEEQIYTNRKNQDGRATVAW
jgi:prevent-host-death family protein